MISRRGFLLYLGLGSYGLMHSLSQGASPSGGKKSRSRRKLNRFRSIAASTADQLLLPPGFSFDVIASYGDPLGSTGPYGAELFGYDNDFLAYFPINALSGGINAGDGLLWVNHEFVNPLLMNGLRAGEKRTDEMLHKEHQAVGGTVLAIRKNGGKWAKVPSPYTRRFTADYPTMRVTGPASPRLKKVAGTLANCSGGKTPWHTALSGEENFHLFNSSENGGLNWAAVAQKAIDETHFGWIVEIDPFQELPPTKHTALGRFAHENAAVRVGKQGHLVVYMGDDCPDQFFYKYVSAEKESAQKSRVERSALLDNGTLYVADFSKGR
jgi:secreted PhoX family phosphatase